MKKLDDSIATDIFYHWMKCFWKENSVTAGLVEFLSELGLKPKGSDYYIVDEKKFTLEMLKNNCFTSK